ncbi:protein canopy-1 [Hippocampus comes]|uniref:Canopy FGF signaling regulator 1 n=1 Tax=Hippocampus comes TaxID=109280 RepID=A0A3Q2XWP5_HIPCM|nr:PREDICTED: protein canopy-1-like [Hippocampus comes]XP_019739370.1 PREDICTED: protein canopy-1-like [Hippocampus comes]
MGRWLLGMTVTFLFVCRYQAKRDPTLYCSACRALVDELNHSIEQVDPKRTIRVGGFRLNPDGSMKDKKVPLARSETHLSELLDGVCNSMSDYALHVDPATQRKQYLRFAPRSGGGSIGDFPDLKNFQFTGPQAPDALKFACEIIVEDLEDDIITLFSQSSEDPQRQLCNVVSDYCNDTSDRNDEL